MSLELDSPLVSVIISCYNHERYVQECIQSIIDQSYHNIELIIIDDGSKDGSVQKINELVSHCERRFSSFLFRYRENKGLCATLNEALDLCSGHFIVPFASDDVMYKDRIYRQVLEFSKRFKQDSSLVAIYSGVEFIDDYGKAISVRYGSNKYCGFKEVILRSEFLPSPTFMVLSERLRATGGYNPGFDIEDLYIRLKLTDKGGKFYVMKEPLVKYRRHGDNLSKKTDKIWHGVESILREYSDRSIYRRALSKSMMVQAHDYQASGSPKAHEFIWGALKKYPLSFFTVSLFKYVVKGILRGRIIGSSWGRPRN